MAEEGDSYLYGSKRKIPICVFFKDIRYDSNSSILFLFSSNVQGLMLKSIQLYIYCMSRHVFKLDELGLEIAQIALPAALALTADPIASLVDTAFIGQIGINLLNRFYYFGES